MLIFDLAFFGYMCLLIIIKWGIDWDARMLEATCIFNDLPGYQKCNVSDTSQCHMGTRDTECSNQTMANAMCPYDFGGSTGGCQPPNLIATLMDMALAPGKVEEPMYKGQSQIQLFLVLLAVLCIPFILCGKPCLAYFHSNESHTQLMDDDHQDDPYDTEVVAHGANGGHEEHDFSELCVHQIIETIEFVLGMVSNTASYLRLWALSLAHSQLSKVFWDKAFLPGLATGNPVFIFVAFAIFWAVTTGVMLLMDTMECFLHALRLHWIEFQSKFYKGDGHAFVPLSIPTICKGVTL